MTQEAARAVSSMLILTTIMSFGCTVMFLVDNSRSILKYEHKQEMLRRVGYVSSMLEWLPSVDTLSKNNWEVLAAASPIRTQVLSLDESPVRTMEMTEMWPYVAYRYSESLQAVISVEDVFDSATMFGCPWELMVIGVSLIFVTFALLSITLMIGNLCAFLRPDLPVLSRGVTVFGLFVPLIVAPVMVCVLVQTDAKCAMFTWSDDVRRSAALYAGVFSVLDNLFPKVFSVLFFSETMQTVNNALSWNEDYFAHAVCGSKIFPPIAAGRTAIGTILMSESDITQGLKRYVPESGDIVATCSLRKEACLVAVVRHVAADLPRMSHRETHMGLLLILIPQSVICLTAAIVYPYQSLGKLTGQEAWRSPWAWRSPAHWPLRKLLQGLICVAFMVGALCYSSRAFYWSEVSSLHVANMRAVIKGGLDMADVGEKLLSCYSGLIQNIDWSDEWLKPLDGVTSDVQMFVNQFYQLVFTILVGYEYTESSVADHAAQQPRDRLPLLSNLADVSEFLLHTAKPEHCMYYARLQASIQTWDLMMVLHLLMSSPVKLREGSPELDTIILNLAERIGGEWGRASMQHSIEATLMRASEYAEIAEKWSAQTVGPENVSNLYATEEGSRLVALEDQHFQDERHGHPVGMSYDSPYVFTDKSTLLWTALVIVLMCLLSIADYVYTALFFGVSRGASSGHGTGRTVLGNDFTMPRSLMNVDHHRLWHNVLIASISMLCVTLVCLIPVAVTSLTIQDTIGNILSKQQHNEEVSALVIEDAQAAGLMQLTSAAWLRTYLSRSTESVAAALFLSNRWALLHETSWPDLRPQSLINTNGESQLLNTLRETSILINAVTNDVPGSSAYMDFILLLGDIDEHFNFDDFYECQSAADLLIIVNGTKTFFMQLLYFQLDSNQFQEIYDDLQNVFDRHEHCFGRDKQLSFLLYMRQLVEVRRRTAFFPSRFELAKQLEYAAGIATQEAAMRVKETEISSVTGALNSLSIWAVIAAAWVCGPLLLMVYRASQRIHASIYYS